MNLYEVNKIIINQMTPLSGEAKKEVVKKLEEFYDLTNKKSFYMLLSNEYKYYTIFSDGKKNGILAYPLSNKNTFANTVYEIIEELGEIYSVEFTEPKDALEIWIKPTEENEPYVFYLFNYENGVVYYV